MEAISDHDGNAERGIEEMLALVKAGNLSEVNRRMEHYSAEDKQKFLKVLEGSSTTLSASAVDFAQGLGLTHAHETDRSTEEAEARPLVDLSKILEKFPYAQIIADMMASFGDNSGVSGLRCWCPTRKSCTCLAPIKWMHSYARDYGKQLLERAITMQDKSRTITMETLHQLKRREMYEYTQWERARKAARVKQSHVSGDDLDKNLPKEMDEGLSEEEDSDGSMGSDSDTNAGNQASAGEKRGAKRKSEVEDPLESENMHDFSAGGVEFNNRMAMRKHFADTRTEAMGYTAYTKVFAAQRNAFFIKKQASGNKVGSTTFFVKWLGVKGVKMPSPVAKAFGYLIYDRIGLVVEDAIKARTGGILQETQSNNRLTMEELRSASQLLPSVQVVEGSYSLDKVVPGLRVGLMYVGDPLDWPTNFTKQDGEVKAPGGSVNLQQLKEEAEKLLKQADFL